MAELMPPGAAIDASAKAPTPAIDVSASAPTAGFDSIAGFMVAVLVLALCGGPPALALHSWLKHGVVSQANLAAALRILAATAGAAGAAARECAAQAVPEHVRRRLRHVSAYAKVNAGPDDAEAGWQTASKVKGPAAAAAVTSGKSKAQTKNEKRRAKKRTDGL